MVSRTVMRSFALIACWALALWIAPTATAQQPDLSSLVHPDVAERLSLDDGQRVALQNLLQARAEALAAAPDAAAKAKAAAESEQKILAVLNDEQRKKFAAEITQTKLMFQFREMKWDDVLNWFARQQDLTLVMDRTPPGTFTYSDVRSYSPSEAIDLLNSVLMTRNFALVRREKMLVVMELSDSIPVELLPRVTLEQLPQRGRFELVSVMFPLAGRPIEAVLSEVKPYLSSYGRAIPLAQSGKLLVIETGGKMQTINELIASVPLPKQPPVPEKPVPPPQPVFAAYPLGLLDPTQALETVRKLIPSEQITVNAKTGVLSAYVVPAQQTALKQAIDQMVTTAAELPNSESVAYQFTGITPLELTKQVSTLVPKAVVTATADRLLVVASPEDQQRIQASLASINILPVSSEKTMKVFDVEPASATLIEAALKSFLPQSQVAANAKGALFVRGSQADIKTASEIIEVWQRFKNPNQMQLRAFALDRVADATWLATAQKIVPTANTWLAADGRQLMMLGNATDIAAIEAMLPQLLSVLPNPEDRKLQIYNLTKNQLARRATLTLTELPKSLATIKIVDGANKSELFVWASETQHAEFAKVLEGLDLPTPAPTLTVPKNYPIEIQEYSLALQILTAEFPEAKITASTDGKSLTVVADDASQTKIADRIQVFNQQLTKREEKRLENYSVKGLTATALQTALTPLLTTARVNVDAERNRLLITADEATHAEIKKLITALSQEADVDQQKVVVAYPLKQATPTQIKTVIDQLLTGATTLADDKLKQLVVTGTLAQQATVKTTLDQVDRAVAARGPVNIRTYETKKLQAAILLPTLLKLWPNLELSADATANRIIASGTDSELEQLGEAIERLVASPDGKPQFVKTYPVPAGEMTTLATILGQIAPQAIISTDLVSRTATVWASEEQQTRVQQAIEQIGKTASAAKEPATYIVKPTQVIAVQTALQTLFPTVGVASVPTSGQLIVVASPELQKRIAEVIELLATGPNASERTVKVFQIDPTRSDLTDLVNALQATVTSQVRIEPNIKNNTLMVVGTAEEIATVSEKLTQLQEQMPAPDNVTSQVYQLQHASTNTAITILSTLVPQATLGRDMTTRTIAATAKASEHRKIAEFLKSYDLPRAPATYTVKPAQAPRVLTSLQALFPFLDVTADPVSGQVIVITSVEQQKRVAEVIELMTNGPNASENTVKVFHVDPLRVQLSGLLTALQATLPASIRLESNPLNNTLLAIGTPQELALVTSKVELLEQQLPSPEVRTSVVYPLQYGNSASALTILQTLVPKATLAQDLLTRTVAATATEVDHRKIAEFMKSFDVPKKTDLETHVYRLKQGSARGLQVVLDELMPEAAIYGSREERVLIATATAEQHTRIAAIVKDFDTEKPGSETRVFPIGNGNATSLRTAVQEMSAEAKVTADLASNSVIVTANAEDMKRIAQVIEEVEAGGTTPRETRFLAITNADPTPLAKALKESFPKADFSADTVSGGVFATAIPEEHVAIAKVVESLNAQPTRLPTLKAFVLKHANPEIVAAALESAFGRRTTVGVSFSRDTKSVFVVGSNQELQIATQLVEQLDHTKTGDDGRRMQLFSLSGVDGKSIATSIESLFKDSAAKVAVSYDLLNERLYVTGDQEHLKMVEDALTQLTPPKRDLEIIQLNETDPYSFKTAAEALFSDEPLNNAPQITVDSNLQQVLVRATKEQLENVHKLLKQMGEASAVNSTVPSGRLRFVPVHRNSQRLLDELQRLWPTMRDNPLQIIEPGKPTPKPDTAPEPAAPPKNPAGSTTMNTTPRVRLASIQDASPQNTSTVQEGTNATNANGNQVKSSPIIVVTGEEQWTLASDDTAALDQLSRLLDSLLSPSVTPFATTGNFSVYLLRHAGADQVQELLTELFKSGDRSSRSPGMEVFQRVKIVADSRINGLIVSGNRADRKIVEELLGVIDSDELLDTLQQVTPTMVQLNSASAKNVVAVIEDVYKSQLSANAGRRAIEIPEGVTTSVAIVLQQLNAQASGPLLTIAIDETTNTIILRAPLDLATEIKTFIEKLDKQSIDAPGRRVQLLRLESTNTKNLEKALKLLMSK
ncbi:MAG: secretin N-terminal domain-containing protein [Pirellulaceae bacterium]|nr:secretin N-terminal domain-containing protein [Pirellulaceae bacterium]